MGVRDSGTPPPGVDGKLLLACPRLAASVPRSGAVPEKGPGDIRDLWTCTSGLSRAPDPGAEGVPSQGIPATGSENLSGAAHQGAPAEALKHPRALTLAVTAAKHRETAEELGGVAAPPPPPTRRRGSGSGSQQALP